MSDAGNKVASAIARHSASIDAAKEVAEALATERDIQRQEALDRITPIADYKPSSEGEVT